MTKRSFLATSPCVGAFLAAVAVAGTSTSAHADALTYEEQFTQGQGYALDSQHVNSWVAFRSEVNANAANLEEVTLSGSRDPHGVHCTDPAAVKQLAAALGQGTFASVTCDGRRWAVGRCGTGIELNAHGGLCKCPSGPAYAIRPAIRTDTGAVANWGGIAGQICGAPSQTITLSFAGELGSSAMTLEELADYVANEMQDEEFKKKKGRKKITKDIWKVIKELEKAKNEPDPAKAEKRRTKAAKKLDKLIERTDGCALRGAPDPKGNKGGSKGDRITDCGAQQQIHTALTAARDALRPQ